VEKEKSIKKREWFLSGVILIVLLINFVLAADPTGPDSIIFGTNETKTASSAQAINLSGGRILSFNISATTQNPHWKAFIGSVTGTFTLDDSDGATIYNWSLSSISGRVYTTRANTTVTWSSIECANETTMEAENSALNHTSIDDNITTTFDDTTHSLFWVGSTSITANSCPTLNTFVNNQTQDSTFEEMVLYDSSNIVYATILEEDSTGYDGQDYDFQMIVPENADLGFSGYTLYYLYVELS
jgi:hypothetical protein